MRPGFGRALAAGVIAAAVFAMAGCGHLTVGDGSLSGDWPIFAEPKVPTPEAGVCAASTETQVDWQMDVFDSASMTCGSRHQAETYYVGELTSGSAGSSTVPEVGDPAYREAYEGCAKAANDFLGGDWHRARVEIVPVMPTANQWRGEARWYRCEMFEVSDGAQHLVTRRGSLKDGLRGSKPLALTCANESLDGDQVTKLTYVSCKKAHYLELTGIYTAADKPYPGDTKSFKDAASKCFDVGARYMGYSPSGLRNRGGIAWLAWGGGEAEWSVGDRGFRCFMGDYPRHKRTGSIKG